MGIVIRFILAGLIAFFAIPWCATYFWQGAQLVGWPDAGWWTIGAVALASVMVWWRKPNWLIHTMIHEASHAIVCWALLVRVRSFQASDGQGGKVIHDKTDPIRTTLIALAPYTVPLLLIPALVAHHFASGAARSWAAALVGFLYVHHLHGLYHNVRLNRRCAQADLVRSGRLLSLVVIVGALMVVTGYVLRTLF